MNTYQIADLERLTGIKAHTLRIWEKRYKLIEPHRTETNIRYYDNTQARKLLNISTLLERGIKISKIAALTDHQLHTYIQEIQKQENPDIVCHGFINDLIASMLNFDENAFDKVLSSTVNRFGIYEATIRVIYPFLFRTGVMWASSETLPVQEHFASNLIRRKILTATDGLPFPSKISKRFLLFLPENEWHETGLLVSDYLIRSNGFKTIYLGQNVPLDNLQEVIKNTKPTHLLTLLTTRQKFTGVKYMLVELQRKHKNCKLLVASSSYFTDMLCKMPNLTYLASPSDLVAQL